MDEETPSCDEMTQSNPKVQRKDCSPSFKSGSCLVEVTNPAAVLEIPEAESICQEPKDLLVTALSNTEKTNSGKTEDINQTPTTKMNGSTPSVLSKQDSLVEINDITLPRRESLASINLNNVSSMVKEINKKLEGKADTADILASRDSPVDKIIIAVE